MPKDNYNLIPGVLQGVEVVEIVPRSFIDRESGELIPWYEAHVRKPGARYTASFSCTQAIYEDYIAGKFHDKQVDLPFIGSQFKGRTKIKLDYSSPAAGLVACPSNGSLV